MRIKPLVCAALAALLGMAGPAMAQSATGGLRGAVRDAQGVIPGVTVTLTNDANGVSRDTISNASGEYSFPAVDPSTYSIRAGVQGFKTRSEERRVGKEGGCRVVPE